MTHTTEQDLILHYYGEPEAAPVEEHLAACAECRERYRAMQLVLNTVTAYPVPDRDPAWGEAVWSRLEPKLAARRRRPWWWFTSRQLAAAGAMAVLLVAAFLAGRMSPATKRTQFAGNTQVRERILLVAVGDHLQRSQMVLAELANAPSQPGGKVDISLEQRYAADLVDANRLFRQTASYTGDSGLAAVLEDLERLLVDVANGKSELTSVEADEIRGRIESQGLLFKVRVVESQVREREKQDTAPAGDKL